MVQGNSTVVVSTESTSPVCLPGLEQVVAFHDGVLSGARPQGTAGMRSLAQLEVSTIVCVDGVAPDVEQARKLGIETIHIPLKYHAPSQAQIADLAAAVAINRERGNVYIHCHHGRHRSAAAAALALIALNLSEADAMQQRMQVSETSRQYTGLWDAVKQQQALDQSALMAQSRDLPSVVRPQGMTAQMVQIDEALDRLLLVQESNWEVPDTHPDLAPAADAGMIAETFRAMQFDQDASVHKEASFMKQVREALQSASILETALNDKNRKIIDLNQHLLRVEQSCITCHRQWRK